MFYNWKNPLKFLVIPGNSQEMMEKSLKLFQLYMLVVRRLPRYI